MKISWADAFNVQMFGYLLYVTEYAAKDNDDGSALSIPKVQPLLLSDHLHVLYNLYTQNIA